MNISLLEHNDLVNISIKEVKANNYGPIFCRLHLFGPLLLVQTVARAGKHMGCEGHLSHISIHSLKFTFQFLDLFPGKGGTTRWDLVSLTMIGFVINSDVILSISKRTNSTLKRS